MPKVEMKQVWIHDNEVQLNTLAQGMMYSGPVVPIGTGSNARIGNEIRAMGVHLKGALYNNSGAESFVRLLVLGHSGSLDPSTQIFRNTHSGNVAPVSTVNGMDAIYFPVNKNELHVYHDRVFRLGGSATGTAASNTRMFSKFIKLNGRKVQFEGGTTGLGTQNWSYSIVWIAADANDDTSTGTVVELSQLHRFYFKDP